MKLPLNLFPKTLLLVVFFVIRGNCAVIVGVGIGTVLFAAKGCTIAE